MALPAHLNQEHSLIKIRCKDVALMYTAIVTFLFIKCFALSLWLLTAAVAPAWHAALQDCILFLVSRSNGNGHVQGLGAWAAHNLVRR
jgi:hypothetical protein